MSWNRKTSLSLTVALGLCSLWLAACGGSKTNVVTPPAVTNVSLSDPAACAGPSGPYSHVYVTIVDVEAAASSQANSGFTDLTPNLAKTPVQVDLLGQANNQCFLAALGSTTQLQPGDYQQIRIILAANNTTVTANKCGNTGANCVVLNNGTVAALNLSSEANTGLKIPSGQIAGGKFTVSAGTTKDLDIDFDTCDSIVAEGNGQFRLKPVLHAGEISTTATSIQGTVVDKTTGLAVSGTAMVALEQKDAGGTDRIFMTTLADANGNFVFCPVPAGSYDVVATAISSSNIIYAATVTTGVPVGTAMGKIPLLPAAAPAAITGQVTTSTGTAATSADLSIAALQTAGTGAAALVFTMPLVQQSSGTASLATAAGASCAANTDCASYTLSLPGAPSNLGAYSSSGTSWSQSSATTVAYSIEADAFVPSSGGTADCAPPTQSTADTDTQAALAIGPGLTLQAALLSFTGCQ